MMRDIFARFAAIIIVLLWVFALKGIYRLIAGQWPDMGTLAFMVACASLYYGALREVLRGAA